MKYYHLLLLCFLTLMVTSTVHAQTEQIQTVEETVTEDTEVENGEISYAPATHANLAALFYKFRVYDKSDDKKLSDYVKTLHCNLYEKYIGDEFIWINILSGTRRDLQYYSNTISDRLEILTPIPLGRYNFSDLAFQIHPNYQLINDGAVIFPFTKYRQLGCERDYSSQNFPSNMKFIPDNKYAITKVPIYPEQADPLLDRIQKNPVGGFEKGSRVLLARIRIKINSIEQFDENGATFRGQMDEITFFEDDEMTRPVWTKNFKDLDS